MLQMKERKKLDGLKLDQKKKKNYIKNLKRCMVLLNEINQLQRNCDNFRKDKERLLDEMQQINQKHTLKYGQNKNKLKFYLIKLRQSEFNTLLEQKSNRIKVLELERERLLVRVQNLDRLGHTLGARNREILELREQEQLTQLKRQFIILDNEIPKEAPIYPSQQDNDVFKLRKDLLYLKQEKERALDEAEYWMNRYQDLELAEDRFINLMEHQNKNEYDHNLIIRNQKYNIYKIYGINQ